MRERPLIIFFSPYFIFFFFFFVRLCMGAGILDEGLDMWLIVSWGFFFLSKIRVGRMERMRELRQEMRCLFRGRWEKVTKVRRYGCGKS